MHFDWWTLALQAVNFAILVWLLQRFLYRPVLRLVDARRAEIERQFAAAHEREAKAEALERKAEADRAAIATERSALLKAAEAEAGEAAAARRARAEAEAAQLLDGARKAIAKERAEAAAAVREAALDLAARMAERLIAELPIATRAEAWLERIERALADMPPPELARVLKGGADSAGVTVVTAAALPADQEAQWRRRLGARLGDAPIAFAADARLIAGTELRLPNAVLRLSWQSALDGLRAEAADADAR